MPKKRMLLIMEPPTANSGFGTVSKAICPALAQEFDCTLLATGGYGMDCAEGLDKYGIGPWMPTTKDNVHGINGLDTFLNELNPDVIFSYYDIGSIFEYINKTFVSVYPHASYLITEGEPFMNSWKRLFHDEFFKQKISAKNFIIDEIILSSQYAVDVAKRETGRDCTFAYHGVDHAPFRKLPNLDRQEFKKQLSKQLETDLTNTFIVGYVARNAGRKMWPRLFHALKRVKDKLKAEGSTQKVVLLAQTKPFDDFKHEGWVLHEIVERSGLDEKTDVFFGETKDFGGMVFDAEKSYSMVKMYNILDLYVHPSAIEGCGLPILEAAKCGVPVLTTEYAAGWEYAKDYAMPIKVLDFLEHSLGVKHALIDIEDCANKIYKFMTNPALCAEYSNRGIKHCNFSWKDLQEKVVKASYFAIEKAYAP